MMNLLRFFDDVLDFLLVVGLPILALFALFVAGLHFYGKYQCENYQEITGKKTQYASFDTCYIETGNGFQRWDEYKARSIASEGLKRE